MHLQVFHPLQTAAPGLTLKPLVGAGKSKREGIGICVSRKQKEGTIGVKERDRRQQDEGKGEGQVAEGADKRKV